MGAKFHPLDATQSLLSVDLRGCDNLFAVGKGAMHAHRQQGA